MVYPSVFSPTECDLLVEAGEACVSRDGAEQGGIEGLASAEELRDSSVGWIARTTSLDWAFERLEAVGDRANERWLLEVDGILEDLQYTLYDRPGAHYTWHHDGLDEGVEDRKLSLVLQLSDPADYSGADLEFLEVAVDYDDRELAEFRASSRARGAVVAFCGFEYHRVTPVESGVRRSLVAWVSGPRLR